MTDTTQTTLSPLLKVIVDRQETYRRKIQNEKNSPERESELYWGIEVLELVQDDIAGLMVPNIIFPPEPTEEMWKIGKNVLVADRNKNGTYQFKKAVRAMIKYAMEKYNV